MPCLRRLLPALILLLAAGAACAAEIRYGETGEVAYGEGAASGEGTSFTAVRRGRGLSLHKENFILPATWTDDYNGEATEVLFQLSIKQRMFMPNLYFGYTQKSFWQAYYHDISAPFRETNYNPEIFYRWLPGDDMLSRWHLDAWGFDLGIEHESNGQTVARSRSWNRVYFAPFRAGDDALWYFKTWYRLPEPAKNGPTDPGGDDNPDIADYYGYGEVSLRQAFGEGWMIGLTGRGNLDSGKGAIDLRLSRPAPGGDFFLVFDVFNGYGESLIDYNRSTTRVGIGLMFNR
jgi:phospholipase A1